MGGRRSDLIRSLLAGMAWLECVATGGAVGVKSMGLFVGFTIVLRVVGLDSRWVCVESGLGDMVRYW